MVAKPIVDALVKNAQTLFQVGTTAADAFKNRDEVKAGDERNAAFRRIDSAAYEQMTGVERRGFKMWRDANRDFPWLPPLYRKDGASAFLIDHRAYESMTPLQRTAFHLESTGGHTVMGAKSWLDADARGRPLFGGPGGRGPLGGWPHNRP